MSELGILNVGSGDTKLTFDPTKPEEMRRAARIVNDMIRRGYSILVEGEDAYGKTSFVRAHAFDETKFEYIIADDQPEESDGQAGEDQCGEETATRGRGKRWKGIPAASARGVAVGKSAGG